MVGETMGEPNLEGRSLATPKSSLFSCSQLITTTQTRDLIIVTFLRL